MTSIHGQARISQQAIKIGLAVGALMPDQNSQRT
jgi:hypothetical protein